jgi:hypothetical protein
MERITIAIYRPKAGKETQLLELIKEHMPILKGQGLITDRKPVVMQAEDKTIVEVFGWKSADAIKEAHTNQEVQKLWHRFSEVCDYDIPTNVKEFTGLFSEFTPIN